MFKRSGMFALCLMLVITGLIATPASGAPPPAATPAPQGDQVFSADGVSAPVLAQAPLGDSSGAVTLVLERLEVPANTTLPERTTPGPEIIFVESGEFSIQDDFGFGTTISAGQKLVLNPGTVYTGANNNSTPTTVLRLSAVGTAASATPIANDAAASTADGGTVLLQIPVDDVTAGATIYLAQATFNAGSSSGEQSHVNPVGVYITEGTLKMVSPSGLEGDIQAGHGVTFPASTPLQARTESGATALILGVSDSASGLFAEATAVPAAEKAKVKVTSEPTAESTPLAEATEEPAADPWLYRVTTDEGFESWGGSGDWKTVRGMLVNDGTNDSGGYIAAPYRPATPDYAIEAEIQFARGDYSAFGIVARASEGDAYTFGIYRDYQARIWAGGDYIAKTDYKPGGDWHTYRVEVRGNELRYIIDGTVLIETVDNRLLEPGRIGLWSDSAQISIRSFTVYSLDEFGTVTQQPTTASGPTSMASDQAAPLNAFVGSWEGTGYQTDNGTPTTQWPIIVTIAEGKIGATVGAVQYPSLGCSADLTYLGPPAANAQEIQLHESITIGHGICVNDGTFTFSLESDAKIAFNWVSPDTSSRATGILLPTGAV